MFHAKTLDNVTRQELHIMSPQIRYFRLSLASVTRRRRIHSRNMTAQNKAGSNRIIHDPWFVRGPGPRTMDHGSSKTVESDCIMTNVLLCCVTKNNLLTYSSTPRVTNVYPIDRRMNRYVFSSQGINTINNFRPRAFKLIAWY